MDILKDCKVAVIVAIMGGSDTLNYKLEPNVPNASMRWALVKELNKAGIWTGVRWEPIMAGINDKEEVFDDFLHMAQRTGCRHVSFYNYRTSNAWIGKEEFEKRGYNYVKMLEGNLDENWRPKGKTFVEIAKKYGVKVSSPDFVNFPFDNACESCCGTDGLFVPYEFTFQHACKIILQKGSVCWDDMEEIDFRNPEAYERMKECWNGGKVRVETTGHTSLEGERRLYSLKDSSEIILTGKDKRGYYIYKRREEGDKPFDPTYREGMLF